MDEATGQRYQIIKKIDAGGMAEIFLAKSQSVHGMEKRVAIKRVLPSLTRNAKFIEMFLDEARLSISLNHANIVQVFDVAQSAGTYFIVMEFVDGYNVRRIFQRASEMGYRIPVPIAAFIMMEVCKGLEFAHNRTDDGGRHLRIVHRDLSPPNILISKSGEVKITDFGLAKATSQLTRTDPGIVKGKYSYLSPEVTEGKTPDHRTDIFAAGVVIWELLADRRLFLARTDVETVEMVRKTEIPSLSKFNPGVDAKFEAILARALARDPKKRFTSAREFGDALADYLFEHKMKTTSYDVAQMVEHLFDEKLLVKAVSQRQERITSMIDEEITNLSLLGLAPATGGAAGNAPVDVAVVASIESGNGRRFDLGGLWGGEGKVTVLEQGSGTRSATLKRLEEVDSGAELVRVLEGEAPVADSLRSPQSPTGAAAPMPPQAAASEGGSRLGMWLFLALLAAGAVALYLLVLAR